MPSDLPDLLRKRGVRVVALQFPAGLKREAANTASSLRREGFEVIISGDPCYGACDLALDTLRYADVLVHFGHTPIDEGNPRVIFEPFQVDFEIGMLEQALPLIRSPAVGLVTTAQHVHLLEKMAEFLRSKGISARRAPGSRGCREGQVLGCAYGAARVEGVDEILFVGTGIFHPLGVRLATNLRVIALDPFSGSAVEVSVDRFLRRRFALIEKARSAEYTGLLVSTKSGQNRFALARHLAADAENAFIILMNEISPDELLNLGFGAYVNFACPRLAYDDQIRFPAPVLSPQEFEILTGRREFKDYQLDELT